MESPNKLLDESNNNNPLIFSNDCIYYIKKKNEKPKYRSNSYNNKYKKIIQNDHFKIKSNESLSPKSHDFFPKIESKNQKPLIKEKKYISPDIIRKKKIYNDIDYDKEYKNLMCKESQSFIRDDFRKNSMKINRSGVRKLQNKYFSPVLIKDKPKRSLFGSLNSEFYLLDNNNVEENNENQENKNEDKIEETIDITKNNNKKLSLTKPIIIRRKKKSNTEKIKIISIDEGEDIDLQKLRYKGFPFSQAGTNENGVTKTNQDSYLIINNIFNLKYDIYGIFDGHGTYGELASQYVKSQIEEIFTNPKTFDKHSNNTHFHFKEDDIYQKLTKNNYSLIKKLISKINNNLSYQSFDIDNSGTTLNMIIRLNLYLLCINVGDSRSIILKLNYMKNKLETLSLSKDHKPFLENEKKRIENLGGEVHKMFNISNNEFEGPFRVFFKGENYPGIAISRSLGDYISKKIGVICEPDITVNFIDTSFKLGILGSDGLWDVLSEKDISNISFELFKNGDIEKISEEIVKKCVSIWGEISLERDDITVIVVFFYPYKKSRI